MNLLASVAVFKAVLILESQIVRRTKLTHLFKLIYRNNVTLTVWCENLRICAKIYAFAKKLVRLI